MLIFADSLIRLHLWFIVAMIYLYFVLILSDKYWVLNRIVQFQMPLITILFIANLLTGEIPHLIGYDTPGCFSRNWLITGMPAFLLGNHIHKCNKNHSRYFAIILCILGIVESWMAFRIIGNGDTYLGSILVAYVFVYGVRLFSKIRCVALSHIVSTWSWFIYIIF